MATTTDYINSLKQDKTNLVNNLIEKGVDATEDETFTSLVPKVLDIKSGGGTPVEKGLVINAYDTNGYVTDASIVGMTSIPEYYCYNYSSTYGFLKELQNLTLPSNLTSVGANSLKGCSKLTLTELPSSITSIGNSAFENCSLLALTELPSNITKIDSYTFRYCGNLALTELPSGITAIGSYAFYECSKLALTKLPDVLKTLSSYAFYKCTNLALTELPNNFSNIENYTFYGCSNLALKEIPEKVTLIGTNAFQMCSSLTEITIKGNIGQIKNYSFHTCSNLQKIALPNVTKVPTLGTGVLLNTPIASGTGYIYVPDSLVDSFKTATNWSTYADQIKGVSEL